MVWNCPKCAALNYESSCWYCHARRPRNRNQSQDTSHEQNDSEHGRRSHERKQEAGSYPDRHEYQHAQVLGLKGSVSKSELQRLYRLLARQYHPDKVAHLGPKLREVAEEEFKRINEAYSYFCKKYNL